MERSMQFCVVGEEVMIWRPTQIKIIQNKIKMATRNFNGHIQNEMLMCSEMQNINVTIMVHNFIVSRKIKPAINLTEVTEVISVNMDGKIQQVYSVILGKLGQNISRCSYSLLLSLSPTSQLVNLKTASVFNTCQSESRQNLRREWFLHTPVPASHLSEVLGSCWRSRSLNPSWLTPDCVCLPSSSLQLLPLFSTLSPPTQKYFSS